MITEYLNKIHCGDCLKFMKQLPDKCVDLVLTDPPYGRKITKKDNQFGSATNKSYCATGEIWDDTVPTTEVFNEIFRISKNQIIFGGNYFSLPLSEKWIVWDKQGDIKFDNPFSACELAWTNKKGVIEKFTVVQQGFIKDTKDIRVHPTQKPSELFEMILDKHSIDSDIIFDPFMGSGTTAIASYQLGRRWFGCEISPEYCAIANKRITEERNNLFETKENQNV